jgi:hypothetical protein
MRRRIIALAVAFCIALPGSSFAAETQPSTEMVGSSKAYVTSGDLYDVITGVNPNFTIYYDDKGYLTIVEDPATINHDDGGEWLFVIDTILVLQRPELKDQKKIIFLAGGDLKTEPVYEFFGIDDYNGPDDFSIYHTTMTTDDSSRNSFDIAFNTFYSAHEMMNKNKYMLHLLDPEKNPAPDYFNDSDYWAIGCFGEDSVTTSNPDTSTLKVTVHNFQDSPEGGAAACILAYKAMERYQAIKAAVPDSLPNNNINVNFTIGNDPNSSVFNMTAHWDGKVMVADTMNGSSNSISGIKAAIDMIAEKGL